MKALFIRSLPLIWLVDVLETRLRKPDQKFVVAVQSHGVKKALVVLAPVRLVVLSGLAVV
jgi:hypothetical protein